MGAAICRRPDDQCWVHGGTAGKGKDMEDRDGEKGPTCEHGENKDNGVWYQSGCAEEIWKVPLWCLV